MALLGGIGGGVTRDLLVNEVPRFSLRVLALYRGWEEPMPKEPVGVYQHSDGRPLLGRKLKGRSEQELCDPGLVVDDR